MKKTWIQVAVILLLSTAMGLGYNYFFGDVIPVFEKYRPEPPAMDEDLSRYYSEMDIDTLKGLMESGMIILLDARKADMFTEKHIPGAVSLPIWNFNEKYPEVAGRLDAGKTIVLYCIDIHCTDSSLLARELHKKGHPEIFVYKGGIEEWTALGNPVQTAGAGENTDEK